MRDNASVNERSGETVSQGGARAKVVVIGGGPGGYEAALVAAQLGADVTVVDADGLGGAAVLTDVVPSKTLIATAEVMTLVDESVELGVRFPGRVRVRCRRAGPDRRRRRRPRRRQPPGEGAGQSTVGGHPSPAGRSRACGWSTGRGRLDGAASRDRPNCPTGHGHAFEADTVLIATGAHPRELPDALPDGERILTWKQLYDLDAPARSGWSSSGPA